MKIWEIEVLYMFNSTLDNGILWEQRRFTEKYVSGELLWSLFEISFILYLHEVLIF